MTPRVGVRALAPDEWPVLRDLRLAALRDSPGAFGTTYERAAATEDQWRARLERPDGTWLVGLLGPDVAGLVGAYVRREDRDPSAGVPELISMWVAPAARGSGLAVALVDAVAAWAAERGAAELRLMVAADNVAAQRFYERIGFRANGYAQPMPHDAARPELELVRDLRT